MSGNPQLNPCLAGTKSEPTEDTNLPPNMKVNEEKKVECDLHSKDPDTTLSSTFDRIYEQCDCCPDWVYTTGVSPDEDDKEEKKKMEKDEDDNHAVPYSSSNQSTDDHTVQSQPSEDHPTRSQLTENQSMKNPIIKNQLIETHPTASKPVNEQPARALPIASQPIQNLLAAPEQAVPANLPSQHTAYFVTTKDSESKHVEHDPTSSPPAQSPTDDASSHAPATVTPTHLPPPHTAHFTTIEHHTTSSQPSVNPPATPSLPASRSTTHAAHFTSTPQAHPVENQPTGWMWVRGYCGRWLRRLGRG